MALTKTPKEIDAMREGGHILSRALKAAVDAVRPGITLREIDTIGEASMRAAPCPLWAVPAHWAARRAWCRSAAPPR